MGKVEFTPIDIDYIGMAELLDAIGRLYQMGIDKEIIYHLLKVVANPLIINHGVK